MYVNEALVPATDTGKMKCSEKNLCQCHFIHHKFHMDWPRIESGFHNARLANDCLSHGMDSKTYYPLTSRQ